MYVIKMYTNQLKSCDVHSSRVNRSKSAGRLEEHIFLASFIMRINPFRVIIQLTASRGFFLFFSRFVLDIEYDRDHVITWSRGGCVLFHFTNFTCIQYLNRCEFTLRAIHLFNASSRREWKQCPIFAVRFDCFPARKFALRYSHNYSTRAAVLY